tara:strand:- start:11184 stop:12167 length:984 start_codon:yes stop_codon:yes gene_type:complete
MISLGIESTAHTFGVGIIDSKGKVLANVKDSVTTKSGGIIPLKAAEHHIACCDTVVKEALKKSGLSIKDVDLISFSQSPGIGNCLRIGAIVARSLSVIHNIPIIGVNHAIAHLEIGKLICKTKDPVMLYASGANTQIIAYENGKYRIFGETLDNGIGNFLDGFARELGLGFPGGPKIYDLSLKSKKYIELPYTVKGMDVSFGGLLTNLKQKIASKKFKKEDLAYSVQETVFAMLIEVSERALAHAGKKELLLAGGVGCNIRLQEMCDKMCVDRGAKFFVPQNEFLVDNGAMIAWLGLVQFQNNGRMKLKDAIIKPYLRTDDVEVYWK